MYWHWDFLLLLGTWVDLRLWNCCYFQLAQVHSQTLQWKLFSDHIHMENSTQTQIGCSLVSLISVEIDSYLLSHYEIECALCITWYNIVCPWVRLMVEGNLSFASWFFFLFSVFFFFFLAFPCGKHFFNFLLFFPWERFI